MRNIRKIFLIFLFLGVCDAALHAEIINGSFESGLTGWTVVDRTDPLDPPGTNTFFVQSGTETPLTGMTVPKPPNGNNAAMTDAGGPGGHVLYQDFLVPMGLTSARLSFSLLLNNLAGDFFMPNSLDFSTPARNQQARVDILTPTSGAFSVASADVLLMLFQTQAGTTYPTEYQNYSVDVSPVLASHQGQTLRLRFAEVNNVDFFNLGVDNVVLAEGPGPGPAIPEPGTGLLIVGSLALLAGIRRRRA